MKAHELLSDASKWTKGAFAKNKDGIRTNYSSRNAVCWCLLGAMDKCYDKSGWEFQFALFNKLRTVIKTKYNITGVSKFNDAPERTFEEVHNLLKELDI